MANYIVLNENQLLANLARKLPNVKFEVFLEVIKMCEVEQEPKVGHWNSIPKYLDIAWCCSECEHFTTMKYNYCPNCGCRMESEVEQ